MSPRAVGALAWEAAGFLGGTAYLLCALLGLGARCRKLRRDGVLALLALAIVVQLGLVCALQPRHVTWLYPAMAPFVVAGVRVMLRGAAFVWSLRERFERPRTT